MSVKIAPHMLVRAFLVSANTIVLYNTLYGYRGTYVELGSSIVADAHVFSDQDY